MEDDVLKAPGLTELLRVGVAPEGSLLVGVRSSDGRSYQLEIRPNLIGPMITALIAGANDLRSSHQSDDRFQFQLGFAKGVDGSTALEVLIGEARLILPVQSSELRGLQEQLTQAIVASDPDRFH